MDKKHIQEKIGREITVSDLVRTGHRPVKLGADKGSGFIYCGDAAMIGKADVDREILGRRITDIYPSVDEKGAAIVLFEGSEKGRFWTTAEYIMLQSKGSSKRRN